MPFAYDTAMVLQSAVHLVNSALDDSLSTVSDLDGFFAQFGYTGRHDRTVAELAAVCALRPRLRELLLAPRDKAVAIVNEWLVGAQALPQLVRHDGFDWHLHAISFDQPLADRIVVETAMAMIDVIRSEEHSRFAVCAADDCEGVVLDLSRNRSRRFCSTTCGNRVAVAAYRARNREES